MLNRAMMAAKEEVEEGWERIRELEERERELLAEKEREVREAGRRLDRVEAELGRRVEALRRVEEEQEVERKRMEDTVAGMERRIEELGESNMSEVRIAQAKAEVMDLKREAEERVSGMVVEMEKCEIGQLKYDLVEMEEMMGEYRERCHDAEEAAEMAERQLEEVREAAVRQVEGLEGVLGRLLGGLQSWRNGLGRVGEHEEEMEKLRKEILEVSERGHGETRKVQAMEMELKKAVKALEDAKMATRIKGEEEYREAVMKRDKEISAQKKALDEVSRMLIDADRACKEAELARERDLKEVERRVEEERARRERAEEMVKVLKEGTELIEERGRTQFLMRELKEERARSASVLNKLGHERARRVEAEALVLRMKKGDGMMPLSTSSSSETLSMDVRPRRQSLPSVRQELGLLSHAYSETVKLAETKETRIRDLMMQLSTARAEIRRMRCEERGEEGFVGELKERIDGLLRDAAERGGESLGLLEDGDEGGA
ncbi:hypothetical protein BC829DRAFT_405565 [Chytridium lagenaria]|nr:hypothetical protein BC829DRAFT_405565 [Chytridium lagenaria]